MAKNVQRAVFYRSKSAIFHSLIKIRSPITQKCVDFVVFLHYILSQTIKNTAYLKYELYKHNVGDTIKISYIRNGKEYIASVVLKKAM